MSAGGPYPQATANQLLGGIVIIAVLVFVGLQVLGFGVIDTTLVIALLSSALALLGAKEAGMYFIRNSRDGHPAFFEHPYDARYDPGNDRDDRNGENK